MDESRDQATEQPISLMPVRTGLRAGQTFRLGDAVAAFTHATGLDKLAEKYTEITGRDCGCKERQELLNRLVSF